MSTVKKPLKYLWKAEFKNGHVIIQPENDQRPDHDPDAEYNPSAFSLISDYLSNSPLLAFSIFRPHDGLVLATVWLATGEFSVHPHVALFRTGSNDPPHNPDLIFYRVVQRDRVITPIIENGKIVGQTTEDKDPDIKAYALGWKDRGKTNEHVLVLE